MNKSKKLKTPAGQPLRPLAPRLLAALLAALGAPAALALPTGVSVLAGSGSVAASGGVMTVSQSSASAYYNATSMNIAAGERLQVNAPAAGSLSVFRVWLSGGSVTPPPTSIEGMLNSNGNVMLINSGGILFGAGAQVNVAGLIATSVNWASGNLNTAQGMQQISPASASNITSAPQSSVVNNGSITVANGGIVALVAPGVANNGTINAPGGRVSLAAARNWTIDPFGDGLVHFSASPNVTLAPNAPGGGALTSLVGMASSGRIHADGGKVLLAAGTASNLVSNVINMEGVIQARSVSGNPGIAGSIVLLSGNPDAAGGPTVYGTTRVSGTLDAGGLAAGQSGGTVKVFGENIEMNGSAVIDVRGAAASGKALVGGNKAIYVDNDGAFIDVGTDATAPLAYGTFVGRDVRIKVNAGDEKNSAVKSIFGYTVYEEGELPVILSSGHDGVLIDTRISGSPNTTTRDTHVNRLVPLIVDEFVAQTGLRPHVITNYLRRTQVDVNRGTDLGNPMSDIVSSVEAAKGGASVGLRVYNQFHSYMARARSTVSAGSSHGLYIDLHGYDSGGDPQGPGPGYGSGPKPEIMWGYGGLTVDDLAITGAPFNIDALRDKSSLRNLAYDLKDAGSSITFAQIIRGNSNSLPGLMAAKGNPGTPSQQALTPNSSVVEDYFDGGYNTDKYGSRYGGVVDGVQAELPKYIRFDAVANARSDFANHLATSVGQFFLANYGIDLSPANLLAGGSSLAAGSTATAKTGAIPAGALLPVKPAPTERAPGGIQAGGADSLFSIETNQ